MKKILSAILCVAMGAMLSLGVAGCSGSGGNDINPDADTTLKVSVYAAGYGTGWIEEACRIYSEDHPEVGFTIEANNRMFDTIKTRLETGTCDSDIVLIANANYSSLVALGVLEELSGVYNAVIPGTEGTTVRSVIPDIQYNYRVRNGGVYGVPWQDATAPGFIYNKTLFKEHGWNESPDTMTEFFELCDEIAKTDVAPLVYGGGQENGYAVNILNQWFVEYYGYDYIANTFMEYASPDIYSYTLEGRQKVYETAARLLQGQTANGESIALAGSRGFTAQAAQREFIQGHAAMDICGNWFPTEMAAYLKGYPDFEYGYMPIPHINDGEVDYQGKDSSKVRYSLDGNILAVPASSQNKEVAKDFLVSMYMQESYQTFVEENNGVLRPTSVELDETALDEFTKASYDYFNEGKQANQYIYECSTAPMAVNGYLALLISQNGNTLGNIINATSYDAAMGVAAVAAADDYTRAMEMWDSDKNQWKDSYLGVE